MQAISSSQAAQLLATLQTWRYAATTYFLWDIVGDLAQLSKVFQKSTLLIHQQLQFVASTKRSVRATYLSDKRPQFGTHFKKWSTSIGEDLIMKGQQLQQAHEDVSLFQQDVRAFAEAVITSFEECFPDDKLMESASVLIRH